MTSKQHNSELTLDQVFRALEHWRNNKDQYNSRGIPKDLWKMIIRLEDQGFLAKDLKRTLSLNSKQYDDMREKLSTVKKNPDVKIKNVESVSSENKDSYIFSEAKVTTHQHPVIPTLSDTTQKNKKAVATLKSTNNTLQEYLDMNTIIVEYMRPDGHRLKIHTTSECLDKVMSAFAQQGVQVND